MCTRKRTADSLPGLTPLAYEPFEILRITRTLSAYCLNSFFFFSIAYKIIIMKCKMNKIYNNNKQWVNEKDVGQFIHPEGCHPRMLQE